MTYVPSLKQKKGAVDPPSQTMATCVKISNARMRVKQFLSSAIEGLMECPLH